MGYFDDLPLIEAQRKALEAGREKFPDRFSSPPGGCAAEEAAMDQAYAHAAELAFSGTEQEWIDAMDAATAAHDAYSKCLYVLKPVPELE
jgi:hypothetical protein